MLKQFTPQMARETILKRVPLEDMTVPARIQDGIQQIFGKNLSPEEVVKIILKDVKTRGDAALQAWTEKLDGVKLEKFAVETQAVEKAVSELSLETRNALDIAIERVQRFHQSQPGTTWINQTLGGSLGQMIRPIRRVGLYIPAGSAPLPSTLIMSAVIAQVAGVREIAVTAPPEPSSGQISPIILATAAILGLKEIYSLGGAQAIGALAYGTEQVPAVDKIFGPGNLFVSLAKKQVFGMVGIDSIAGPTETMILADDSADPKWVAADLLAQAEHDMLAAAVLATPSQLLIDDVQAEIETQRKNRSRDAIIQGSLADRSGAILTQDLNEAVDLANLYAPEHLCLSVQDPWALSEKVYAAGGIFLGESSCEVLGDYAAGPSHIMPTSGSARFNSPLNVLDFVHLISLVALNRATASEIASAAQTLALNEGLDAHAFAAQLRMGGKTDETG